MEKPVFRCNQCGAIAVTMERAYMEKKAALVTYVGVGVCGDCGDRHEYKLNPVQYFDVKGKARPSSAPKAMDLESLSQSAFTAAPDALSAGRRPSHRTIHQWEYRRPDGWDAMTTESTGVMRKVMQEYVKPKFPKYRHREIQVRLAGHVAAALRSRRAVLMAEAGVGTGKTFAYLVPLLWLIRLQKAMTGPVIISTKTNNLLAQLMRDDVPIADRAIPRSLSIFKDGTYDAVSMAIKGQSHYACLNRLSAATRVSVGDRDTLTRWILDHHEAERDVQGFPVDLSDQQWEEVSASGCRLEQCPDHPACPYFALRQKLRYHDGIIITNHNLLAHNLWTSSDGREAYWSTPKAVIVDEAHAFEQAVRQQLSTFVSPRAFRRIRSVAANVEEVAPGELPGIADSGIQCAQAAEVMFQHVQAADPAAEQQGSGFRVKVAFGPGFLPYAGRTAALLKRILDQIDDWETVRGYVDPQARRLVKQLNSAADRLHRALTLLIRVVRGGEDSYAAWREAEKGSNYQLAIAPIHIGDQLVDLLWDREIPVVLLSATLVSRDGFDPFKENLGLAATNSDVKVFQAATEFDYPGRVRIFTPAIGALPLPATDFDDDADEGFTAAIRPLIWELLNVTGGRSLVLFTSYSRMTAVYDYLIAQKPSFSILVQRPGCVHRTLREFQDDQTSVLLATGAFWEGVDVEGPSLSQVIMDKLPFPVPSDPLVDAQKNLAGPDWFNKVFVPAMFTQLRQGSGRLIRSETDWGIISVLDPRARTRFYGTVKPALPDAPWVDDLQELKAWFDEMWALYGKDKEVPAT